MSVGELKIGEWVATVDGEIVGRGASLEEAAEDAADNGYEDVTVERVAGPGTFLL